MFGDSETAFPSTQDEANFSICFPCFETISPISKVMQLAYSTTEECEEERESLP